MFFFIILNVLRESIIFCVFKLADDRMALVSGISLDPEAAIGVTKKLPPKWIEGVDEVKQTQQKCRDLPDP